MAGQTALVQTASVLLRLSALLSFRLAHLHAVTLSLFAAYAPLFIYSYINGPSLEVVEDEIDITVTEATDDPKTPLLTEDGVAIAPEPEILAEEIDVEEKITLAEQSTKPWEILLYGAPNPRKVAASASTFLINLLLVVLTLDSLYRARLFYPSDKLSFARLGYVSHNEANFLIREPDQSQMPISMEYVVKEPSLSYDSTKWHYAGAVVSTTNETDFTATLTAALNHPLQRTYLWKTSNGHSGEFRTPPKAGATSLLDDGKFTFLSTSCILPQFPYNPLAHGLAIPGLRPLAQKLPELGAQFMLFLGDFIYVDVPQRFGKTFEEYRMQYRQVYASPDWTAVSQNLSWIHVLDDHEISNDWSAQDTGVYNAAMSPWQTYQASVNPPQAARARGSKPRPGATWYEFTQGPASFFMADTRSYRSSNKIAFEDEDKSMLGSEQLEDLLAWLSRPEPLGVRWKILASSVPFTKNWPINRRDTWGGFIAERKKILDAMWESGARGTTVVVISGDRHEFAATKFPPPPDSEYPEDAAAFEFSTSPLNQFSSPFKTYKQADGEDVLLKYIPAGTSKFGAFTFEEIAGESTLQYRLFIDGVETWETMLIAPQAVKPRSGFSGFLNRVKFP